MKAVIYNGPYDVKVKDVPIRRQLVLPTGANYSGRIL